MTLKSSPAKESVNSVKRQSAEQRKIFASYRENKINTQNIQIIQKLEKIKSIDNMCFQKMKYK